MISRTRILWLAMVWVFVLVVPCEPQSESDMQEIEDSVMCMCGCANMVLSSCRCDFSTRMRAEIRDIMADGKDREEVIQVLVQRYGEVVLATPKQEGFNLAAYFMPFVALLAGAIFLIVVIRRWKGDSQDVDLARKEKVGLSDDDPYREQLERELKAFKG